MIILIKILEAASRILVNSNSRIFLCITLESKRLTEQNWNKQSDQTMESIALILLIHIKLHIFTTVSTSVSKANTTLSYTD